MNLVYELQKIGCADAHSEGVDKISALRDKRWVKMFAERGYEQGNFVFINDSHSFFIVLPDRNIASADNIMLGNGFYAVAETLGIDAENILGTEPYGETIMFEDEDGNIDEDCMITIWSDSEFLQKLKLCVQLSQKNFNESKNVFSLKENELKYVISETIKRIIK